MRRFVLGAALVATGCNDYSLLETSFCSDVMKSAGASPALCDDFEAPSASSATPMVAFTSSAWKIATAGDGAMDVYAPRDFAHNAGLPGGPDHAYRGHQALLSSTAASGGAQVVESTVTPKLPVNDYALRVFAYFAEVPGGSVELVTLGDDADAPQFRLTLENGIPKLTDLVSTSSTLAGAPISPGGWTCLELDLVGDTETGNPDAGGPDANPAQLSFSQDETTALVLTSHARFTKIGTTHLGLVRSADGAVGDAHVWFDEAVIEGTGDTSIGCEQ